MVASPSCPARRRLALLLLVFPGWRAAAAEVQGLDGVSVDATPRQLQLSTSELLNQEHVHTRYSFDLNRDNMKRHGVGELWMSFAKDTPKMRWRGAAQSPRFGEGHITVVADPVSRTLHTLFKLGELHEAQCMSYPFPDLTKPENQRRLERMRWRRKQIDGWLEKGGGVRGDATELAIQWSTKLSFSFSLNPDDKSFKSVEMRRGKKVVKTIRFEHGEDTWAGQDDDRLFGLPSASCPMAEAVKNPMAELELSGPHDKASALKDLLLVLADRQEHGGDWPRLFLVLSALVVPGDVAVMIEDPQPPDLGSLHALAFDYSATVVRRGVRHVSDGSIWADLDARTFRVRGEAKETKVGPLFMDLVADAKTAQQVFANVNLTVQAEQQCVAYAYPSLSTNITEQLRAISWQALAFYAISDIDDEDCAIFVAPLARGRWIHLWVDLEADNAQAILRSEVHKGGQVIRSTDIKHWLPSDVIAVSVQPNPAWHCTTDPGAGQLAHLGLNQAHKRSTELQDALFSLKELSPSFTILELLGLTGDVAIMVQEPEVPQFWKMPAVSFGYSLSEYANHGTTGTDAGWGSYAADLRHGHVRMTSQHGTTRILLAFEPSWLALQVQEGDGATPVCLQMPVDPDGGQSGMLGSAPLAGAGMFDGVDTVGEEDCNRFTYRGTGDEAVELWFSNELDTLVRISMRPAGGDEGVSGSGFWGVVDVKAWEPTYHPAAVFSESESSDSGPPQAWHCGAANNPDTQPNGGASWLTLAKSAPPDELPGTAVLAKLSEAVGIVGLLAPHAWVTLSRLAAVSPLKFKPPVPPRVDLFSSELTAFSFNFRSSHPLQSRQMEPVGGASTMMGPGLRSHGEGEVHVNLQSRWFFLKSKAQNVSAGMPALESQLIFRGDRERLYTRTIFGNGFEQCWSISTADAFPAPPGNMPINPFMRARADADGFTVPNRPGFVAKKHVLYVDQTRRVMLFSGGDNELVAMNVDDLAHDSSTGIFLADWSTAQPEPSLFEPEHWQCSEPPFDGQSQELDSWLLLRLFFPRSYGVQDEVPRRQLSV